MKFDRRETFHPTFFYEIDVTFMLVLMLGAFA